jgi:hypothetical protein
VLRLVFAIFPPTFPLKVTLLAKRMRVSRATLQSYALKDLSPSQGPRRGIGARPNIAEKYLSLTKI